MKNVKPEVVVAMAKIHKKALKAAGNGPRPAVLCECGCTLAKHMDENGKMDQCRGCMDPSLLRDGKAFISKCGGWKPVKTTVKEVRKALRAEE